MLHIASESSNSSLSHVTDKQIQPNAVDVCLDRVFRIPDHEFYLIGGKKSHRSESVLNPKRLELNTGRNDVFILPVGHFEVIMKGTVTVGEGEAGWIITRSTLNRNGLFLTSGLYDSGYHGVMAGVLHVACGTAYIQRGERIGQFLLVPSETLHMYDGDYGHGKRHDAKYK